MLTAPVSTASKGRRKTDHWTVRSDAVHAVEFSPFPQSASFLAYGGDSRVVVLQQQGGFVEDGVDNAAGCAAGGSGTVRLRFEYLVEFCLGVRVSAIAWSCVASDSGNSAVRRVKLAAAAHDFKVYVLSSNLMGEVSTNALSGHASYVNDCAFSPTAGDLLATVGDDLLCLVWNTSTSDAIRFKLTSPGRSVCWHVSKSRHLMVAEQRGVIRFFDLDTETVGTVLQVDPALAPLTSAHWNPIGESIVGVLAGGRLLVFDKDFPAEDPIDQGPLHAPANANTRLVRWCNCNRDFIATTNSALRANVRVSHSAHFNAPDVRSQPRGCSGLSWHAELPCFVTGGEANLHFWFVAA